MDAVLTCMVSDSLASGERSRRLAAEVAAYLGLEGGVGLREYSRAVRIAIELLDLPAGAKVLLSPLSPVAYATALLELGLTPFYLDVAPENGCLRADEVEKALSEQPSAAIVTTPLGFVPEMESLAALGIPIVEDVSMGIGGTMGERRAGSLGRYIVIRLEQEDIVTTGGGALVLAAGKRELTNLRQSAMSLPETALLSDMNAALGLTQIASIEQHIAKRKEIAQVYMQSLLKSRHKSLVQVGEGENIWYSFPVLLNGSMKECVHYARKKGVETASGFQDTIAARLDIDSHAFPNARALLLRCILFPLYPSLGKQNVLQISKVLSTLP